MLRRLVLISSISSVVALLALANPAAAGSNTYTGTGPVTGTQGGGDLSSSFATVFTVRSATGATESWDTLDTSFHLSGKFFSGSIVWHENATTSQQVNITSGALKRTGVTFTFTLLDGTRVKLVISATGLNPQTVGTWSGTDTATIW